MADDPIPPIDQLAELGQRLQAVAGVRLLRVFSAVFWAFLAAFTSCSCLACLLSARLLGLGDHAADRGHDVVLGKVGVPDVHRSHLRELRHRRRYAATDASVDARVSAFENPLLRAAIVKLAAIRFTSYSNGPGRVSSKSFKSNSSFRSGEANTPKFDRWASPHNWTTSPAVGMSLRSAAMIFAAPR